VFSLDLLVQFQSIQIKLQIIKEQLCSVQDNL